MPLRTGIDLVDVVRLSSLNKKVRKRFLTRVFTPLELAQTAEADERLAGRFAAKEAAAKALGTGIGPVSFQEIEVMLVEDGRPVLKLNGKALELAEKLGLQDWAVSITHTPLYAMAIVIGSGEEIKINNDEREDT
jgi:holo-[acyl-carrier protein] synthase